MWAYQPAAEPGQLNISLPAFMYCLEVVKLFSPVDGEKEASEPASLMSGYL